MKMTKDFFQNSRLPRSFPEEWHCQGLSLTSCWRTPGSKHLLAFDSYLDVHSPLRRCTKSFHQELPLLQKLIHENISVDAPGCQHHLSIGRVEACSPPIPWQAPAGGLQAESALQSQVIIWNSRFYNNNKLATKAKELLQSQSWPNVCWLCKLSWPRVLC